MRNSYKGICFRCGGTVEPGAGHFQKVTKTDRRKWPSFPFGVKWITQHAECAIKYRGTDVHYICNPEKKEGAA
tara:strand:+ start:1035 stop:1253 length:219 start_codon:yes stop_codon:yes gene_type:complete